MKLHLAARPPFSFRAVADSHGWRQLAPFSGDADGLSYIVRLSTGRVTELHLAAAPDGAQVECADPVTDDEQAEIATMAGWMLGLDQDLSAFYAAAQHEPKLAHVAERAQGRLLRSPTLFEDVVKTILTTNTTWSGTKRMVQALVDLFGDPLGGPLGHPLGGPSSADASPRAFPAPRLDRAGRCRDAAPGGPAGLSRALCAGAGPPHRFRRARPGGAQDDADCPPMSCANGCAPSKAWGHTPSPTC